MPSRLSCWRTLFLRFCSPVPYSYHSLLWHTGDCIWKLLAGWWWCTPLNPSTQQEEAGRPLEFEASLVYRASSRTARETWRNSKSKTNKRRKLLLPFFLPFHHQLLASHFYLNVSFIPETHHAYTSVLKIYASFCLVPSISGTQDSSYLWPQLGRTGTPHFCLLLPSTQTTLMVWSFLLISAEWLRPSLIFSKGQHQVLNWLLCFPFGKHLFKIPKLTTALFSSHFHGIWQETSW